MDFYTTDVRGARNNTHRFLVSLLSNVNYHTLRSAISLEILYLLLFTVTWPRTLIGVLNAKIATTLSVENGLIIHSRRQLVPYYHSSLDSTLLSFVADEEQINSLRKIFMTSHIIIIKF